MPRGKFVDVHMRTPVGTTHEQIEAMTAGGDVEIKMPDRGELHIRVTEINKVGTPVRSGRFLASEVLSIVEGQKPAQQVKRR